MKTHVPALMILFFLILVVDTSTAQRILGKYLFKGGMALIRKAGKQQKRNNAREKRVDSDIIGNKRPSATACGNPALPPSTPNNVPPPPPVEIEGLKDLKQYLSSYGYMEPSDSFNNFVDEETKSAMEKYQEFYNLTGQPDETVEQLQLLRCAVPDINVTYDLNAKTDSQSWPMGTKWFPNGPNNLTYGFLPESQIPQNMTDVFRDSFKRWSDAIGVVNLMETTYDDANIKIGFYLFDNQTVGLEVVAGSLIQSQSSKGSDFVTIYGDMLLDASNFWAVPGDNVSSSSWEYGVVDLGTVAMHQIGHLLGLEHSSHTESVMFPYILPTGETKMELSNQDKEQIHQLYSPTATIGAAWPAASGSLLLTTFSLGFACMLM